MARSPQLEKLIDDIDRMTGPIPNSAKQDAYLGLNNTDLKDLIGFLCERYGVTTLPLTVIQGPTLVWLLADALVVGAEIRELYYAKRGGVMTAEELIATINAEGKKLNQGQMWNEYADLNQEESLRLVLSLLDHAGFPTETPNLLPGILRKSLLHLAGSAAIAGMVAAREKLARNAPKV
jgi:hypothetical protein